MSRKTSYGSVLCVVLSIITLLSHVASAQASAHTFSTSPRPALSGFVTRVDAQLLLNGKPFRFAGANMHWLPFGDSTQYTSQFQINDGLDTAIEMGLTVVRSHDVGISTGCANCIEPSLGIFNTTALLQDDYVIQAARLHGIRLIIPLTDNYHYPAGGKHNFTDWRGIANENQFFTNKQVMQDFEQYISVLLNHVNIYTGVAYKDDPTIMAWETGNGIDPPTSWTQTISTFIKHIDTKHLIVEGGAINDQVASLKNIDIITAHDYPRSTSLLAANATKVTNEGKVFIVDEFDWNEANGGDSLGSYLAAIESNRRVSGDAFWELWPHRDTFGYATSEVKYMLHYPGDSTAMRSATQHLRAHAYRMSGLAVPVAGIPGVPLINSVVRDKQATAVTWRGTAIASSYSIERSTSSANGPWTVICNQCATDNSSPWIDTTASYGTLWYRVTGYDLARIAGSTSNTYQVARVEKEMVDDLNDWSKVYAHSPNLSFDTTHRDIMAGDTSRLVRTTTTNEWISWKQNAILSIEVTCYFWPYEAVSPFSLYVSPDGKVWTPVASTVGTFHAGWIGYKYTLQHLSGVNAMKLVWNNTTGQPWSPELGLVTITYAL